MIQPVAVGTRVRIDERDILAAGRLEPKITRVGESAMRAAQDAHAGTRRYLSRRIA